jgi:hypothetical protein
VSTPLPPPPAPISADIVRAHAQLMTHRDLQFDFAQYKAPPTPDWLAALGRFIKAWWPQIEFVGWALLIAIGVFLLYRILVALERRGWFKRRGPDLPAKTVAPEWRPAPEAARNLLRDADVLAQQSRYGDAVHLILLRSIEHIDERRPDLVRRAFTAREIGALEQLPAAARETFLSIARSVERALFAGREVGADEYAQCRAAYERFAFPDIWKIAA